MKLNSLTCFSQQLCWTKAPRYVLVIKKQCNSIFDAFTEIIKHLIYDRHLKVYVEENDYEHEIFQFDDQIRLAMKPTEPNKKPLLRKFCVNNNSNDEKTDVDKIDFIVCLGGDGTLLHTSTLFQKSCPPVLSIHMGSLGFLCPFDFNDYKEYIKGILKGGVPLLHRNRLKCRLEKTDNSCQDILIEVNTSMTSKLTESTDNSLNFHSDDLIALNDVVISRGPSSYLSNLDLYINDYLMTTVQGDGLIISTPTGSTAYAMAAGASMCHPSVQSIIIAPICPHSLSFRPIVVPAGVELKIALNDEARNPSAWYSVDGRNTTELKQGYHISITTSEYPLPSICRSDQINDWFEGLATCLHWNQRQKQLPLNDCYLRSRSPSLLNLQSHSQSRLSFSSRSSSTSSLMLHLNNFSNNQTLVGNSTQSLPQDESSRKDLQNLKLNSSNCFKNEKSNNDSLNETASKSNNNETKLVMFDLNDNVLN